MFCRNNLGFHSKSAIQQAQTEAIGFVNRKHQDWFDENDDRIQPLLKSMHALHLAWISDKGPCANKACSKQVKQQVQASLCQMKEELWNKKAKDVQKATDLKDSTSFFNELKTVCCPKSSGATPFLNDDESSLLTDKGKILERWSEHFNNVLDPPSFVSQMKHLTYSFMFGRSSLCHHRCRNYRRLLDR